MKLNKTLLGLLFLVLGLFIWSCSDEDEYLKYTEGGEVSYTGKIDSLKVYSGRDRVRIKGLIIADPKVTEVRIYWNIKKDSVVLPITRGEGIDTVSVIIDNLPENVYNFEVRTFDSKNNPSIAVFAPAEVYGDRYQNSLFNRPVISNNLIRDSLTVNYASMDLTTGVIGTEILYTSNEDEQKTIFIPIENEAGIVEDFKPKSIYKYRTLFLPEEKALDTFYTEYVDFKPVPKPILANASIPFKAKSRDGRWGVLEDWTTTDPIKIHNGQGGWDEWNGNIFNVESGWGAPAITNGKIYQSVTVEPASYKLNVLIRDTNHSLDDEGGSYFVVAKGEALPDVSNVDTSEDVLVYKRINTALGSEYTYTLNFTVDEAMNITVGQITTQADGDPGRFCNVRSWDIVVAE
ncbi:putative protein DUF5013 [Leeuwenhoekiella aestuarii]|nr:putative protein DUF5013 [Leeuwenhoekiella aestuarii]